MNRKQHESATERDTAVPAGESNTRTVGHRGTETKTRSSKQTDDDGRAGQTAIDPGRSRTKQTAVGRNQMMAEQERTKTAMKQQRDNTQNGPSEYR